MQSDKHCIKEIEGLIDRVQKINAKDLLNRYIISGIMTVIKIAREKHAVEVSISLI